MDKVVRGVLFSRSVRSTFASLTLAPLGGQRSAPLSIDEGATPILVRIQFFDRVKDLRSHCRRAYKLGDMIEVRKSSTEKILSETSDENGPVETNWKEPRLVIDLSTIEESHEYLTVQEKQYWGMKECQTWQNRFLPPKENAQGKGRQSSTDAQVLQVENEDLLLAKKHHGGGLGKRLQGEHIARFLISCTMRALANTHEEKSHLQDPSTWSSLDHKNHKTLYQKAIEYLNSGSGVLDVAGGSGHVSMGLGIRGVKSTVVDARESVGKLPGRDRKIWNRALKKNKLPATETIDSMLYCQPVVPFQTYRAWFGTRPDGVETRFRHPDQEELPVCDESSTVLEGASAIVALHPDEATGAIVEMAVRRRVPLVVVPCCVFARLFPDRQISEANGEDRQVSSYDDLLQFLMSKDSSIEKTDLPFDGKNTILHSSFSETRS